MPEKPLVVPVVDRVGDYGGVWRRAFLGPADANNYVRVVYDALFRFSPDGATIEPKIAEAAEPSADYKSWTIQLRKGAKWSDGQPFGADDIVFWYKDVLLNKELTPTLPGWIKNPDGTPAKVEKVDDNTVRFTYTAPATLFLTAVANQDGADRTFAMFLPAHYLKKFHPAHADKAEIEKMAQAAGFKTWTELFANKNAPPENPERPTMAAWAPVTRASDPVFTLKRNPYYVGVDTAGNQLPYIDEVRFTYFADVQALNLQAIAGNFDMQARHINMTNYPVLKEQEKAGEVSRHHLADVRRRRRGDRHQPDLHGRSGDGQGDGQPRLPGGAVARHQPRPDQGERVPGSRRGAAGRARAVASLLSRRRMGQEIHRVQARRGQQAARRDRPRQEGRATACACCPTASRRRSRSASCRPSARGPTWRCWCPRTGRRSASRPIVQIRERALHFKMDENNELMSEIWNEDTSAFPYTGNAKVDPRNAPILTIGPLWRRWYASGGKDGMEPPPAMKRIVEIVDKARTVAARGAGQAQPGALPHLGRQPVRDRHHRAHAHGAGRGRGDQQVQQRAQDARQRLAPAQPGQRPHRAVLLRQMSTVFLCDPSPATAEPWGR